MPVGKVQLGGCFLRSAWKTFLAVCLNTNLALSLASLEMNTLPPVLASLQVRQSVREAMDPPQHRVCCSAQAIRRRRTGGTGVQRVFSVSGLSPCR